MMPQTKLYLNQLGLWSITILTLLVMWVRVGTFRLGTLGWTGNILEAVIILIYCLVAGFLYHTSRVVEDPIPYWYFIGMLTMESILSCDNIYLILR